MRSMSDKGRTPIRRDEVRILLKLSLQDFEVLKESLLTLMETSKKLHSLLNKITIIVNKETYDATNGK